MAEEKTQSGGTATIEAPGENTVEVVFMPGGKTVQFEHGKLPYKDHGKEQSILDVALNNGVRLDHACGGNCACTTCHVWVKEGTSNLSEMDDDEADRLLWRFRRGTGITFQKNTSIQHSAKPFFLIAEC